MNTLPRPKIPFDQMSVYERCVVFLGVGLGSGLSPKAPGTVGSAAALLLLPAFFAVGFYSSILIILIMSLVGIYICGKTADLMGVHDDGRIVWDEFAGQSITFLPLIYLNQISILWLLIGFALFRLFDIWKPWPIRIADQRVSGGFGIMLDDLIAGLWAALCICLYFYYMA